MNTDSEQIFKELDNLTQSKKLEFYLNNHDESAYFEPFYHNGYRHGKQLNVWSLLSIEARIKPVKPSIAIESWKNLESEGTYYWNSFMSPYNTRLYNEFSTDEIIRGYQNAGEAESRSAKYQKLLSLLEKSCRRLAAFEISDIGNNLKLSPTLQKRYAAMTYYSTCILIGQIDDLSWISLCPSAPVETKINDGEFSYIPHVFNSPASYSSNTLDLFTQVNNLLQDLAPMKIYGCKDQESIFEQKIFCEIGQTEEDAVKKTLCAAGMLKTGEFEGLYTNKECFFEAYGNCYYSDFECEDECHVVYQNLCSYLKSNLLNLTFYRYSLWIHEHIYIVGQTQSEDWLGVKLYSTYTDNP
jgi:hypothetical protein